MFLPHWTDAKAVQKWYKTGTKGVSFPWATSTTASDILRGGVDCVIALSVRTCAAWPGAKSQQNCSSGIARPVHACLRFFYSPRNSPGHCLSDRVAGRTPLGSINCRLFGFFILAHCRSSFPDIFDMLVGILPARLECGEKVTAGREKYDSLKMPFIARISNVYTSDV